MKKSHAIPAAIFIVLGVNVVATFIAQLLVFLMGLLIFSKYNQFWLVISLHLLVWLLFLISGLYWVYKHLLRTKAAKITMWIIVILLLLARAIEIVAIQEI